MSSTVDVLEVLYVMVLLSATYSAFGIGHSLYKIIHYSFDDGF